MADLCEVYSLTFFDRTRHSRDIGQNAFLGYLEDTRFRETKIQKKYLVELGQLMEDLFSNLFRYDASLSRYRSKTFFKGNLKDVGFERRKYFKNYFVELGQLMWGSIFLTFFDKTPHSLDISQKRFLGDLKDAGFERRKNFEKIFCIAWPTYGGLSSNIVR